MLGKIKTLVGRLGSFAVSEVPTNYLDSLKSRHAIPITIATTGTFTVNASKTNPVRIWNGNDYIELKESLAHSSRSTAVDIITSTGAQSTNSGTEATGVIYYYVSADTSGNLDIHSSTSAPSFVEGPFEGPMLGHPGTARTQFYNYVGFAVCTTSSTAAVFTAAVKTGFKYAFAATDVAAIATSASFVGADFTATIPAHGVEVGGYLLFDTTTAATVFIDLHPATTAIGVQRYTPPSTIAACADAFQVYSPDGKIYNDSSASEGDIQPTWIEDIV